MLLSTSFSLNQVTTVTAIILVQWHVLQSQTLLQITMMIHSCFAVSLFLFQCTRWGIPFKSYSRLYAISIQGLMQRTKPSKVRMMSILLIMQVNIHYFCNNALRYLCNLLLLAFSLSPGGFLVTVVFSGLSKSSSFKFT